MGQWFSWTLRQAGHRGQQVSTVPLHNNSQSKRERARGLGRRRALQAPATAMTSDWLARRAKALAWGALRRPSRSPHEHSEAGTTKGMAACTTCNTHRGARRLPGLRELASCALQALGVASRFQQLPAFGVVLPALRCYRHLPEVRQGAQLWVVRRSFGQDHKVRRSAALGPQGALPCCQTGSRAPPTASTANSRRSCMRQVRRDLPAASALGPWPASRRNASGPPP